MTINTIYFNVVIQEGKGSYPFIVLSEACIISDWKYMTSLKLQNRNWNQDYFIKKREEILS